MGSQNRSTAARVLDSNQKGRTASATRPDITTLQRDLTVSVGDELGLPDACDEEVPVPDEPLPVEELELLPSVEESELLLMICENT